MKVDQNKLEILRKLTTHIEEGRTAAIFMEVQERDTHLIQAARAMPDAIVVVICDGKTYLAEKERYLKQVGLNA